MAQHRSLVPQASATFVEYNKRNPEDNELLAGVKNTVNTELEAIAQSTESHIATSGPEPTAPSNNRFFGK